jgi:hypothetical protein
MPSIIRLNTSSCRSGTANSQGPPAESYSMTAKSPGFRWGKSVSVDKREPWSTSPVQWSRCPPPLPEGAPRRACRVARDSALGPGGRRVRAEEHRIPPTPTGRALNDAIRRRGRRAAPLLPLPRLNIPDEAGQKRDRQEEDDKGLRWERDDEASGDHEQETAGGNERASPHRRRQVSSHVRAPTGTTQTRPGVRSVLRATGPEDLLPKRFVLACEGAQNAHADGHQDEDADDVSDSVGRGCDGHTRTIGAPGSAH